MGSGSDYGGFLDFAGIPCLNLEFGSESGDGGVYHSIYDDFYWYTHFGDTNYIYGRALAQTAGTTVLRLADAEVIPYEFDEFAGVAHKYTHELQDLLKHKQDELEERRTERAEGIYAAISDPQHPVGPPKDEAVPPDLNFAPLLNATRALEAGAKRYQQALAKAQPGLAKPANAATVQVLNQLLLQAEHRLTDPAGLPRRPWFKHLLYAPGVYTGYDPKTMPGVREGIELGHYPEAEQEIVRVAKALDAETALLDSATKVLAQFR
jgi:N-acetylated-alpha-linked acidic dipeptidase